MISLYNAHSVRLLLTPGTITREKGNHKTTIDLIFANPPLKNASESSELKRDLHQGSDHYPIQSIFSFVPTLCRFELRPLLKQADKQAKAQKAQELNTVPRYFSSIDVRRQEYGFPF